MRAMASTGRTFLALLLSLLAVTSLFGASPTSGERTALEPAKRRFEMGFYDIAEQSAADFCRKYTNSILLAEGFLLQGKARFEQSNYVGAAEMLASHFNPRDSLADEYLYYIGLTDGKRGQYREAANAFARLTVEYPTSMRLLEASIQQAVAYSMIPDWRHAIDLLSQTNGVFQSVARTNSPGALVFRGFLLLSRAQMAVSNYPDAEATLRKFDKSLLNP